MSQPIPHRVTPLTRRDWLAHAGAGFGALALGDLLARDLSAATDRDPATPAAAARRPPWLRPATARSVIFLFMEGGPSHIDTFDPKPELNRLAGRPLPPSFKPVITPMGEGRAPLMASPRRWKQYGECGHWVSDWLPHIATCADDLAVIRSCWSNGLNHVGGVCQMNTGSTLAGRPSLGSWVSYGLGTENANLPGFVVMLDTPARRWPAGRGTGAQASCRPSTRGPGSTAAPSRSPTWRPPPKSARHGSEASSTYWAGSMHGTWRRRFDQTELDARIRSYELAFRMQAEAPEAVDIASETAETRALYGLDDPATGAGRTALPARPPHGRARASGSSRSTAEPAAGGTRTARSRPTTPGPAARWTSPSPALVKDLKRRGLLDADAGRLGRRVRPDADVGEGQRPRP